MAGTTLILIPSGTQVGPFPVTPLTSICVGPAVLGGSVLLENAPSQNGPWSTVANVTAAVSFRSNNNSWVRITASVSAGTAAFNDLGGSNTPQVQELLTACGVFATPNSTAEQLIYSFRTPPGFLTPNFKLDIFGHCTVTNSATVKTLIVRANGIGGTAMYTSGSLASNATVNFYASMAGIGDGVTIKGLGSGLTNIGLGLGATYPTLVRDYIGQETEFVVTMTKATGTDTAQLDAIGVNLRQ